MIREGNPGGGYQKLVEVSTKLRYFGGSARLRWCNSDVVRTL